MNPLEILHAALAAGVRCGVQNVAELKIDLARQNDKRPAWVRVRVNDSDVKALKGPAEKRADELYLVRLPAAAVREIERRASSPIILPGDLAR